MSKVYILVSKWDEDEAMHGVWGVFTTRQLAEDAKAQLIAKWRSEADWDAEWTDKEFRRGLIIRPATLDNLKNVNIWGA